MSAYPVDLKIRTGEEPVVILHNGTREPLSTWMRRKLNQRAEVPRTARTIPRASNMCGG